MSSLLKSPLAITLAAAFNLLIGTVIKRVINTEIRRARIVVKKAITKIISELVCAMSVASALVFTISSF
ncbi:hypothetical protein D9M71_780410 [compost metagenome]